VKLDPIDVVVEIPQGSRNKYEWDAKRKLFRLDRVLYSAVHYPTDYGYVLDTLGSDGDPLDALVVVTEPTFPGCVIRARPIGVLGMRDEKGSDDKLLTVPVGDPRFEGIADIAALPRSLLAEIEYFFATYKTLERKLTEVTGWQDWQAAQQLIAEARERFRAAPAEGPGAT
jgi:inorganic pyrophosphatase